jgi:microcystin-dependent protein
MAEPFLSEIRIMSFNFAPKAWAMCNGQHLPIAQNQPLFSLLGTTFGGDGRVDFALPDLRGRVPIHVGDSHTLGERAGEQAHTLSTAELPTHTHALTASSDNADVVSPSDNQLAHRPLTELGDRPWLSHTSVRSGCSQATSPLRDGCSARASCCRSPRTRRSSS